MSLDPFKDLSNSGNPILAALGAGSAPATSIVRSGLRGEWALCETIEVVVSQTFRPGAPGRDQVRILIVGDSFFRRLGYNQSEATRLLWYPQHRTCKREIPLQILVKPTRARRCGFPVTSLRSRLLAALILPYRNLGSASWCGYTAPAALSLPIVARLLEEEQLGSTYCLQEPRTIPAK